jgi:hypothetical protein
MKKNQLIIACMLLLITVIWSCKEKTEAKSGAETEEYIAINTEVSSSNCNLTSEEFNKWFTSGIASENGTVKAANSVDFDHNNNCDFYKWSEQMFLWITTATNDQTTMESPVFYTISPKNAAGSRKFIPHTGTTTLRAFTNVEKTDEIETEEGQAGSDDVLMDRFGNMVYYISFGNDVYAQFLTAVSAKEMSGATFPTTATDRDSIVNFAKNYNVELADANALAIELKTSWIQTDSLANVADYITVNAIIPTYTKTSDTHWDITGEETVTLAMVGMHIVGSVSGHPEMIWATFEHQNNAPNVAYQYIDSGGNVVSVPADGDGGWIFNSDVGDTPNVSHMTFKNNAIVANTGLTITPSNTVMMKPWGNSNDTQPNPEDSSPAAANTTVINLNNSITKLLPGSDVRKNYQFIGATWTNNGAAPNGQSYSPSNTADGVAIGTSQLANSTMETYFQNQATYSEYSSCFMCHNNNSGLAPADLSHVFSAIQPLVNETLASGD